MESLKRLFVVSMAVTLMVAVAVQPQAYRMLEAAEEDTATMFMDEGYDHQILFMPSDQDPEYQATADVPEAADEYRSLPYDTQFEPAYLGEENFDNEYSAEEVVGQMEGLSSSDAMEGRRLQDLNDPFELEMLLNEQQREAITEYFTKTLDVTIPEGKDIRNVFNLPEFKERFAEALKFEEVRMKLIEMIFSQPEETLDRAMELFAALQSNGLFGDLTKEEIQALIDRA